MDTRPTLAQFISTELLRIDEQVGFDENLLSEGMVDSLGMLRLIGFIQQTYGLQVPPEDFIIENFRTLEVLNDYLHASLKDAGNE